MAQSLGTGKESIPRPRIQTLSDMIFGLALSIGAVSLLSQKPGNFTAVTYSMVSFGFAFLILALVWFRYSKIMSVLPVESSGIIWANMALLFLVSIEPYLFNLMTVSAYSPALGQLDSGSTTTLYALDLGGLMLILAFFIHELTDEERRLIPRELLKGYRLTMYTTILAGLLFLLSTLPIFWSVIIVSSPTIPLRYLLWCGVWVTNMGRRLDVKMASRKSGVK
ncbi:MAG TPA: TMEM175 family protein [Nitrososphaerales archaeon]|nr:TMEM175 family protein [Nitrososphaerales archaeon]